MNKDIQFNIILSITMLYAILALCLVSSARPEAFPSFTCPNVEVEAAVDISKYLGKWYVTLGFELTDRQCYRTVYSAGENGTIKFVTHVWEPVTDVLTSTVKGELRVPDASISAKLEFKLYSKSEATFDYWVLGTDYESFAVVFHCKNHDYSRDQKIWIMTREQNPTTEVIEKVNAIIHKNNIDLAPVDKADFICKGH